VELLKIEKNKGKAKSPNRQIAIHYLCREKKAV
jgi:hypothetical protein